MRYDPIKSDIGKIAGKSVFIRKLLYRLLDILLLRAWHLRRTMRKVAGLLPREATVLDAGCGFGQYSYRMARSNTRWRIVAVDISEEHVADCNAFFEAANLSERVACKQADITHPAGKEIFHLAITVDVLEHIEDDRAAIDSLYTALKPGGWLIISTPSDKGGSDVHHHDDTSFIDEHVRDGYNRERLTEMLLEAGFSEIDARYSYGTMGSISWRISMKYPIKLLNASKIFFLILPLYYLIVMPFALLLNVADLMGEHSSGTGLIVKAKKP